LSCCGPVVHHHRHDLLEGRSPPGQLSRIEPVKEPAGRTTDPTTDGWTDVIRDVVTSVDALLDAVAPLANPHRMRALALQARRLAATRQLDGVLAALSSGDAYERRTALHMAMAARDLRHIEYVLRGPDLALRRAALRAVRTLPVSDEAAAAVLDDAPAELRRAFYRTLLHGRRHALADVLLQGVRERWGDREAAMLLAACSAPVVSDLLPQLAHAVTAWRTLGRLHPRAVVAAADRELAGGGNAMQWWRRRGGGILAAVRSEPQLVLELLERHDLGHPIARLPRPIARTLFNADPAGVVRLVRRQRYDRWGDLPPVLVFCLRSCSDREAARLAGPSGHRLADVLRALPPGRRESVMDALEVPPPGLHGMPLLPLLPAGRAATEARRMLEWHGSVWHSARARLDDPDIPLTLTSFLPHPEAVGPLTEASYGGDPRRRSLARRLLLQCTARTGDRLLLSELLGEFAHRTAGEQDPLRTALLTALTEVAPALLDDRCAPALDRLFTDALAARDSSPATCAAVRDMAGRILHHHEPAVSPALTTGALRAYKMLVDRCGADGFGLPGTDPQQARNQSARRRYRRGAARSAERRHRLDLVLRRGQEHELHELLRPRLATAAARGDFTVAVALARALGRRAQALPALQDDLRAAMLQAPPDVARKAADLWLRHAPDRTDRVADLIIEDPSTVVLAPVWRTVAGVRTDLLDRLHRSLAENDSRAFAAARADWVPEITAGIAGRWTPNQRRAVLRQLSTALDDETSPVTVRADAVRSIGRMPGALDALTESAGREETVLAETALGALAAPTVLGEPAAALAVLLSHAGGPMARAAVGAMVGCCAAVPPSVLGPMLDDALSAPTTKITVRKAVVRLLARQRPPGAVDRLLRAWRDPDLHQDVRLAVAVALQQLPEDPRALPALDDAVDRYACEPMLRTLFRAQPLEYAPANRPAYANLISRLLTVAEQPGVRFRGARAFGAWAHWYQGGFNGVIADLTGSETAAARAALPVFTALLRTGVIKGEVIDVLRVLTLKSHTRPPALPIARATELETPERDLVLAIVGELTVMQRTDRADNSDRTDADGVRRTHARQAADLLASDPMFLPAAVDLRLALLRASSGEPVPQSFSDELVGISDLLTGRPLLTARVADTLNGLLSRYRGGAQVEPASLLPAARRLAADGGPHAALLALTLARVAGGETSWPPGWCTLLAELRHSPHLEIRHAALEIGPR
jgi:hypothetical protein